MLALFPLLVSAAPIATPDSEWSVSAWQTDDGLPNNYVTGLAQTPDGYLWVATYSSLARFDGVSFEKYLPRDFGSAANEKITALQLNQSGGLWLGAVHGSVSLLDSKSAHVFTQGLPNRQVQTMIEDGEGALWIAYQSGIVCRLKAGRLTTFQEEDGLPAAEKPGRHQCSLARDQQGRIWFAKEGHVGIFRQGRFETLTLLRPTTILLAGAKSGGVWIGLGEHLLKYDEGRPVQDCGEYKQAQPGSEPTVLLEDHQGGVWIGTSQKGLYRYDGSIFAPIPTSDPRISSLAEDQKGNIWVGTESGGLNRIRPRVVELEMAETGLPLGSVRSVCEEANGVVWAATQDGSLLRCENGNWSKLDVEAGWSGGRASCVTTGPDGTVWIGTKESALFSYRGGVFSAWRHKDGLIGREIQSILVAKTGDVWLGEATPDVVQCLRGGELKTFAMPPDIQFIRAMAEDHTGAVWIGTSKGILLRIRHDVVTDETARTSGAPMSIRCLHAAADGSLWLGYADDGIGWLKGERYAHLPAERGLPENSVSQIVTDDQGWLWFAGDHGIFKTRQHALEELALGINAEAHFIRYGQSEGLFSLEANWGASPGAMCGRDGRIWIPMRTALAVVDPLQMQEDTEPPPVLLKRIAVDNRTFASYDGVVPVRDGIDLHGTQAVLRLPPRPHRLEFFFTELSFGAPENIRFRYRLEGLDDNWIDAGVQRSASYSRLAPGAYRFMVQACNADGVWTERGAVLRISVAPSFWQTWWFALVTALVFGTGVALIARHISLRQIKLRLERLQQLAAIDRERARIARDLHDELGTRLTELGLIAELGHEAGASPHDPEPDGSSLLEKIRSMERDLDTIVWAVNPQNDSLEKLVNFICRMAQEFFGHAAIRCRFEIPEELPALPLSPELRHHLFMVVREAMNNVAKHSAATVARLRISMSDRIFHFQIADDGCGFSLPEAESSGRNGLRNMSKRIEEIGGIFTVTSEPGRGTTIDFQVPLCSTLPRTPGAIKPRPPSPRPLDLCRP